MAGFVLVLRLSGRGLLTVLIVRVDEAACRALRRTHSVTALAVGHMCPDDTDRHSFGRKSRWNYHDANHD